ncbi:MAG TPA: amino acid aminotransferase [Ramlibacter sp.]|nr:amino acid aminotransferase [Ramlibacter sp.]
MTKHASLFCGLPNYAGDPILALMDAYAKDVRSGKVSLSIGLYFDEAGQLPVLQSVRTAQEILFRRGGPCPYLPMEGSPAYRQAVQQVVFGAAHPAVLEGRIATIQALGGSGALRVGADLLRSQLGCTRVWVPDPTWDNHFALFAGAGYQVETYPYYDASSTKLRFDAMRQKLKSLPARSVVLLHASCHNPTGMDLNPAQWHELAGIFSERGLIPFIDMAYQGFGDGLDEDAAAVRALADTGHEFLVANSFSKNFSLYGERAGGLSVVCKNAAAADAVLGQLKLAVRGNYSTPPAHGAALVGTILQSAELRAVWAGELEAMRRRIRDMRERLHRALTDRGDDHDFGYLLAQRGMFSYTGLNTRQVLRLRQEHAVYLVDSGRMCMSGLTPDSIDYVADAIAAVLPATST